MSTPARRLVDGTTVGWDRPSAMARHGGGPMRELRERAFTSLADTLRRSLTTERLEEWSHVDEDLRASILDGRIFGTIQWPKAVGRSLGPSLSSGFSVDHAYHELNWEIGPDGQPADISRWKAGSPPGLWDLPNEG